MDGTLVHFIIDYKKARRSAIEEMEKHGVQNASEIFSVEIPWTVTLREACKYMRNNLGFGKPRLLNLHPFFLRSFYCLTQKNLNS